MCVTAAAAAAAYTRSSENHQSAVRTTHTKHLRNSLLQRPSLTAPTVLLCAVAVAVRAHVCAVCAVCSSNEYRMHAPQSVCNARMCVRCSLCSQHMRALDSTRLDSRLETRASVCVIIFERVEGFLNSARLCACRQPATRTTGRLQCAAWHRATDERARFEPHTAALPAVSKPPVYESARCLHAFVVRMLRDGDQPKKNHTHYTTARTHK